MRIRDFVRAGAALALIAVTTGAAGWAQPPRRPGRGPVGQQRPVPPLERPPTLDPGDGLCSRQARATSPVDLKARLESDFVGCIVIPKDVRWEMVDPCGGKDEFGRCVPALLAGLPIKPGVRLIGERGLLGSRPTLFTTWQTIDRSPTGDGYSLFVTTGKNVSVQGLHLLGPSAGSRSSSLPYVNGLRVTRDPADKSGTTLVADNEFNEWAGSAIDVNSTIVALNEAEYPVGAPFFTRDDLGLVLVMRNYLHHNARDGGGYGVTVGHGAFATITGNVFDFNRHAVASDGRAHSGYSARFNYVLQGGFEQSGYWNQHFDVHGTANDGYAGPAGDYYEVAYNTIRGEQTYSFLGVKSRPSWMLRGRPTGGAHFNANVDVHDDLDEAVSLKWDKSDTGFGEDHGKFNFHAAGNSFDTDNATEIAAGDFDGDGRTDVFVATGTAWFYSRGGVRPWEFLHASDKRTRDLALADIDNDGTTDVLYRDGAGALGVLKSGVQALVPLTTSPVPIGELRFGDFDGDARTDIFYTRDGQWMVWFGASRTWTPLQTSSLPVTELLFGEFDDVRGTDVAAPVSAAWSTSSGATRPWARLNAKLKDSFSRAVAADFDGNGRTDIAFTDGRRWVFSADGRGPLTTLRAADGPPRPELRALPVGRFTGGRRATVISFAVQVVLLPQNQTRVVTGAVLQLWHGLGSAATFATRSTQNMR